MIFVSAELRDSPIHGIGVFITKPMYKGMIVWKYIEPIDYRLEIIPDNMIEYAKKYAYKPIGKNYWEFCGDIAMFINHSLTPNISKDGIANRDIAIGEELTYNYYEIDSDPESGGKL